MTRALITLTTDFGRDDPFVGIMKGVISGINASSQIIDLSHAVPPQDVFYGALILASAAPYFPAGTIHVAVVDPGVGSTQRALLIEAESCFYIGPDNGILSFAVGEKTIARVIQLTNDAYFLKPTSNTFHGRDIFAPVAAHLSGGVPAREFGTTINDFVRLAWPEVSRLKDEIEGEIIYIDRFGNLMTNIREEDLRSLKPGNTVLSLKDHTLRGLHASYASGAGKELIALINSCGLLEIARFQGSAQAFSGAERGERVLLRQSS